MKTIFKKSIVTFSLFVTPFLAQAQDSAKNLPLVFDPQTQKYFVGGTSKFTIKPNEQSGLIDRIEVSVDDGAYQPYNQSIEFKTEGKHTLKFRAINPVNNWSPIQFVEVFVDLTPATTEAKLTEDTYYKDETGVYVGLKSQISLRAQDDLSGVGNIEYSWDGSSFTSYTKPIVVEKSGKQTLYFRSFDRVGNMEAAKKMEFAVDSAPPSSEIKLTGTGKSTVINGLTYLSDSMAISLATTDDQSKVKQTWVELDGKKQPYIKPIYVLEEGKHTITYHSVDNVGNAEAPKTLTFFTVTSPPRTSASGVGKSVNMGGVTYAKTGYQLKFAVQDNIVGTERTEFKINNEDKFRQYIEPINFTTPGVYNVVYRSVDRTGISEPEKNYTVNVVNTPPETKLSTAQPLITRDGVVYSPAPNVITLNVSDAAGVGVEETLISINDAPFAPYRGPITLDNNSKVYKISYKSVDKLGNEEQAKFSTYNMIKSMPVVDLFISSGQSTEEKVRTNFLDQGLQESRKQTAVPAGTPKRVPSNTTETPPKGVPTALPEKKK